MGFSRQEHWSGLPFPYPGDLSDPGIEPGSPALQADTLPLSHEEVHIVGAHWFLPSGSEEEGGPRNGLRGHAAHLYPWRGLRSKDESDGQGDVEHCAWMARCPGPTGTRRGQTTREGLRSPESGGGGGGHGWGNLAGRGGREGPGSGHVLAGDGRPKRGKTWALAPGSSSGP